MPKIEKKYESKPPTPTLLLKDWRVKALECQDLLVCMSSNTRSWGFHKTRNAKNLTIKGLVHLTDCFKAL